MSMKAVVLEQAGSLDHLRVGEAPVPEPRPHELRVRVQAAALNPVDYKLAQGSGHPAWRYPFILGLDVAGVVDAVGEQVRRWQPGDRVVYHGNLARPGGFAEYAVVVEHVVAHIPEGVSFQAAAAVPCAGYTAFQAVHRRLHVQAGQTVLVQGGAGGVGGFAVQLAALTGASMITTASPRNFEWVWSLGAEHVIDYNTEDVRQRVGDLTGGRGVDAIVDTVGEASATAGLDMLAFGGGMACVVALPDCARLQSLGRPVSVHGISLGGAYFSGDRRAEEDLAAIGAEMMTLLEAGQLDPMISQVITWDGVADGLRALAARHVRGKIVAKFDPV